MTSIRLDSDSVGDPKRFVSLDDLQHVLAAMPLPPVNEGQVALIVRRRKKGQRQVLNQIELSPDVGVPGDVWERQPARNLDAQIAVMQADIARLIANGQSLALFGGSLFIDLDLSAENLPARSRVRVGKAVLQVTPVPHNGCQKFRARFGQDALRFVCHHESTPVNRFSQFATFMQNSGAPA